MDQNPSRPSDRPAAAMARQFDGQRVLVIGASSGIGRATAAAFVRAGAHVVAASRGGEKLDAAAAEIGAVAKPLDVVSQPAVTAFFAAEAPFDHVVVSVAMASSGSIANLALEDAHAAMDTKFFGAYRVAKAARITPGGTLTFVSGFLSERPSATAVLKGAINAALEALARGLALELAPVRVNTVSPGLIDTPLWDRLPPAERDAMFAAAAERLPVRRIGQPHDVANAILFLAATGFATGSNVRVDGGGTIA